MQATHKIPKFQNPWGPLPSRSGSSVDDIINGFNKSVFPTKSITSVLPYNYMKGKTGNIATPKLNVGLETSKLKQYADGKTKGSTNWLSNNSKNIGNIGNALGTVSSFLPDANDDPTTNTINQGYDAIADAAMAIPGYGTIVGGAMKLAGFGNKALAGLTGGATTIKNPTTTTDKILSSNFFALTPMGLANSLGKTKVSGTDQNLANAAQQYGGVNTTTDTEIGGVSKAFSWLTGSKNKAKQKQGITDKYNAQNALKANVVNKNQQQMLASTNSMQDITNKNYQKLSGGFGTNILSAKEGLKLIKQKAALLMKDGGTFNVIPSGALHAHKHNLPDEVADGLTKKGIPVIMEDGGEITQQAEIEREEIIFNLDLTKKLEELLKKFEDGDEEAAIEAGKLLTYEILENTVDNVGLINKIE